MRHVMLTCKNHPELRWHCKSIAFTPGYGYNQSRNIFYCGNPTKDRDYEYGITNTPECNCPPTDLVLAPEEIWDDECKNA